MGDFDKRKMLEVLVDPNVSVILAELEGGEKTLARLSGDLHLPESEIRERLSYVIEHGYVVARQDGSETLLGVDNDKLNKIMEADENFDNVIDGLTELDQFLN